MDQDNSKTYHLDALKLSEADARARGFTLPEESLHPGQIRMNRHERRKWRAIQLAEIRRLEAEKRTQFYKVKLEAEREEREEALVQRKAEKDRRLDTPAKDGSGTVSENLLKVTSE